MLQFDKGLLEVEDYLG